MSDGEWRDPEANSRYFANAFAKYETDDLPESRWTASVIVAASGITLTTEEVEDRVSKLDKRDTDDPGWAER